MELYSEKTEKTILASLITNSKKIDLLLSKLKKEYFYFTVHQIIFDMILELHKDESTIDIIILSDKLESSKQLEQIGGSSFLAGIISDNIDYGDGVLHHIEIIINKYNLRETLKIATKAKELIESGKANNADDVLSNMAESVIKLSQKEIIESTDIESIIKKFSDLQEDTTIKMNSGQECIGISTGYNPLDKIIDGYREKHLWVISAYTSVGKSSCMINLVKRLLDRDKRVCIFSLEMSQEDLFGKILALETEISTTQLVKNLTNNDIYSRQLKEKQKLSTKQLSIYSELSDIEDILLAMKSEMTKNKVDVFFIDYIQNISSKKAKDEYHLLTFAVKEIQALNRRLNSTVVLLSQISNETSKGTGLINVDGKGTGAIKAASDLFMYLKREGSEEEILEKYRIGEDIPIKCIINKNRHGRIGSFNFNLKQTTGEMYIPI
jgi:replicative DNA helicase